MDILNKLIARADEFPTLPTIYSTLSDVMSNPRSTAHDVANIIAEDQAAAAKVLKAANSPIYGFRGRISTISQAIIFIGFEEVRNLVIAMGIIDVFRKMKGNFPINPVDLWKHSIAVGIITRLLGKTLRITNLENYFLAGILHDIGKLLFLKFIPDEYAKSIEYAMEKNLPAREAENAVLGVNHIIAGEILAEKWKLPQSLKDAIRYHAVGKNDNANNVLVGCVHIANTVASLLELGQAGDDIVPTPNLDAWKALNLPDNFWSKNYDTLMLEYDAAIGIFLLN
ncbi:MAG TPA: HDOD domain-containing protein [Candidatus Kapabacteria bacterium]|jgi:putative nucleotidyltransferase with HDIG domain|nr:HDOD domain-containing protein [Candidatus Kapabacteria bacterium]